MRPTWGAVPRAVGLADGVCTARSNTTHPRAAPGQTGLPGCAAAPAAPCGGRCRLHLDPACTASSTRGLPGATASTRPWGGPRGRSLCPRQAACSPAPPRPELGLRGCPAGLRLPERVPGRSVGPPVPPEASGREGASAPLAGAASSLPLPQQAEPVRGSEDAFRRRLGQRAMPGSAVARAGPRGATGFGVIGRNYGTRRPGEGAVGPAQP